MLKTFSQAKSSSIINIAGLVPTSTQFAQLLNDATEALLNRGDWEGTIVPFHFAVQMPPYTPGQAVTAQGVFPRAGVITVPPYVGHIRKMNICRTHMPLRGLYFDFLDYDKRGQHWWNGWCGPEIGFAPQGYVPTLVDVPAQYNSNNYQTGANPWMPSTTTVIRAYADNAADIGKTVTLYGLDNSLAVLRTTTVNPWTDGITLTLVGGPAFATSAVNVSSLHRVLKDATSGTVRITAYNTATAVETALATYSPAETNPAYARYNVFLPNYQNTASPPIYDAIAACKLRFVPVVSDNDPVLIENLFALKLMMQALRFSEAGDQQSATAFQARAISELNAEYNDANPVEQTPISHNPFNGVTLSQQCF